jgi:hypothetical protein
VLLLAAGNDDMQSDECASNNQDTILLRVMLCVLRLQCRRQNLTNSVNFRAKIKSSSATPPKPLASATRGSTSRPAQGFLYIGKREAKTVFPAQELLRPLSCCMLAPKVMEVRGL